MALWGNKDDLASKPKFIDESKLREGEKLLFVDQNEARVPENKSKGINSAGWWLHYSYEDAQGQTRHKAEHLVAFSHANPETTGDADGAEVANNGIKIKTHPKALTVAAGEGATFTVVATNIADAAQTYVWKADGVALEESENITGVDTDTLVIADATDLDGVAYSVTVSAEAAADKTSKAAVLTVEAGE